MKNESREVCCLDPFFLLSWPSYTFSAGSLSRASVGRDRPHDELRPPVERKRLNHRGSDRILPPGENGCSSVSLPERLGGLTRS